MLKSFKKYLKGLQTTHAIYKKICCFAGIPINDYFKIRKLGLFLKVMPYYTMVSYQGLSNAYEMAILAEKNKMQGAFVECGTYRGGCVAVMAYVARRFCSNRKIWLFDSFKGNPEPTEKDGRKAVIDAGNKSSGKLDCVNICVASYDDVVHIFSALNLFAENIIIQEGWFQETLPKMKEKIGPIAILRLDCDWYESIKFCLENLYENVVSGGSIIIDDYGYWQGARVATDEFMGERQLSRRLLRQVDAGCYYFLKP